MSRLRVALPVIAAALAWPALVSAHHMAAPDSGCAGLNFTDPRGDSPRGETDLIEGFISVAEGGRVTYNVRLASLPEGKTPGLLNHSRYYVHYRVDGYPYHEAVTVRLSDSTFEHGEANRPNRRGGGDVHRGTPALLSFVLPFKPGTRLTQIEVTAAPGTDVPDDDVAAGADQTAACVAPAPAPGPEGPAPVAGEPARPAAPAVGLRRWSRGLVVSVRPATRGRIELLRDGRRVRTIRVTAAQTRVRLPRRRPGVYRARFRADDPGIPRAVSRALRVRR
jgi:hypothetical protein